MLIADMVRRVRESAGDIAVLQFSNQTVTDWINDGIRECVIENSLLQARGNSSTAVGTQDYVLPADVFKVHSVYVAGAKVPILTLGEWEDKSLQVGGSGTPQYALMYAGSLSLAPTPDAIQPIVINYSKTPTAIAYTQTPEEVWIPNAPSIPEAFHSRIVTYCLAQVAFQDDDYAKYQALMVEFKTGVLDLKHLKDETENLYPSITYIDRDLEQY